MIAVSLESVRAIREAYGPAVRVAEWFFTGLFTIEYVARLVAVRQPLRYALSFYGFVDLLGIAPTFLSLAFPGTQSLLVIRALRLLRVFRVLTLTHFVGEARLLRAGIVTVELGAAARSAANTQACPSCGAEGHGNDARYCKRCGSIL